MRSLSAMKRWSMKSCFWSATSMGVAARIRGQSQSISSVLVGQSKESGAPLVYGQSITDKCMAWERTEPLFTDIAEAVRKRRS